MTSDSLHPDNPEAGPSIEVWEGDHQVCGRAGMASPVFHVHGRVTPDASNLGAPIHSVSWSLNSRGRIPAAIGPTAFRVAAPGDFTIFLERSWLRAGENSLLILANDAAGRETTHRVTVELHQPDVPTRERLVHAIAGRRRVAVTEGAARTLARSLNGGASWEPVATKKHVGSGLDHLNAEMSELDLTQEVVVQPKAYRPGLGKEFMAIAPNNPEFVLGLLDGGQGAGSQHDGARSRRDVVHDDARMQEEEAELAHDIGLDSSPLSHQRAILTKLEVLGVLRDLRADGVVWEMPAAHLQGTHQIPQGLGNGVRVVVL